MKIRARRKIKWWIHCIGIVLFIIILSRIPLSDVFYKLTHVRLAYLIACLLIYPLQILIKSFRWKMILSHYRIMIRVLHAMRLYLIGTYVGFLTPSQLGDFVKAYYLKREGHSLSGSFFSVLIDRGFDVSFIIVTAVVGIFVYRRLFPELILVSLFVLLAVAVGAALLMLKAGGISPLTWIVRFLAPRKIRERIPLDAMVESISSALRRYTPAALGITFASTSLRFLRFYLLALGLGIPLNFAPFAACIAIAFLLEAVPISFAGVGVRELSLIIILSRFGIGADDAVSLSLLMLFVYLVSSIAGLVVWLAYPVRTSISEEARE